MELVERPGQAAFTIVRGWVALAWGLKAVLAFASTGKQRTPRRPNSLASMSPQGPPLATRTSVSMPSSRHRAPDARGCQASLTPGTDLNSTLCSLPLIFSTLRR